MKNHYKDKIWSEIQKIAQVTTLSEHMPCKTEAIQLNFQHQNISSDGLDALCDLAKYSQLSTQIHRMFEGDKINISEKRAALHTALRAAQTETILVDGSNIMDCVASAKSEIQRVSDLVRNKLWLGYKGQPITDIVNIGIGGSDLGPRFCLQALAEFSLNTLKYHFVSDVSPNAFELVTKNLNPETTLFILSSKSFTTRETLYNARKAFSWIGNHTHWTQHFIAVTANTQKAKNMGFKHIIPIWDWVGGRFSFCSAINLITAIAIGYERFEKILEGARNIDEHFLKRPFNENLPVLLGLIGIWNINFHNIHNHLMLTYAQALEKFVPYIQQLDMESNGKTINKQGQKVIYATGPIIWGGAGNQAQHSYYQSLYQGSHQITADFITVDTFNHEIINEMAHDAMNTLVQGVGSNPMAHDFIPGQTSLNHLQLKEISPFAIGALLASYEHKIFTQSVIWDINPFNQPGVENAKKNTKQHFAKA